MLLPVWSRASFGERVLTVAAVPAILAFAVMMAAPVALLFVNSLGDVSDWWDGAWLPRSLAVYGRPHGAYVRFLSQRYDLYTGGIFSHWYPQHWAGGDRIEAVVRDVSEPPGNWRKQAEDARACFRQAMPWTAKIALHTSWSWAPQTGYENVLAHSGLSDAAWQSHLRRRFGDIEAANRSLDTEYASFEDMPQPSMAGLDEAGEARLGNPLMAAYKAFLDGEADVDWYTVASADKAFYEWMEKRPDTGGRLETITALLGVSASTWHDVALAETLPEAPGARAAWEAFVRTVANPSLLVLANPSALAAAWAEFLVRRHGTWEAADAAWRPLELPRSPPSALSVVEANPAASADWVAFARSRPAQALRVNSPEAIWRRWLAETYGSPAKAAEAHGVPYADWGAARWPQPALDRWTWERHHLRLLAEGLGANYRRAWLVLGRTTPAVRNTAVCTLLFVMLALTMNAGIAWCLVRFAMPAIRISLLYFLAVAAFPVEAVAIPNFVVLRQLGLLNTLWALVLPTAVNGYFILLLKGAFESIPVAYVEEAQIEGAGEWELFWHVGLPMARPMLAVVALSALLLSYSNYLWALIVGQDHALWTIPVALYSLRNWYVAPCLVAAAMALVTAPPLVVFLAANRILQRGLTLAGLR